jgi:hypothetical protein
MTQVVAVPQVEITLPGREVLYIISREIRDPFYYDKDAHIPWRLAVRQSLIGFKFDCSDAAAQRYGI